MSPAKSIFLKHLISPALVLLLAACSFAQPPERGPLVLNINVNGSTTGHVPFFARRLIATTSFFTGAPPQPGTLHDVTSEVAWASSDPTVVTIPDASGNITSTNTQCTASPCTATITATYGRLHASVTFTIYSPLSAPVITNVSSQPQLQTALPDGEYQSFAGHVTYQDGFLCSPPPQYVVSPSGCYLFKYAQWMSSNSTVAPIDVNSQPGLVRAMKLSGSSTISCTFMGSACTSNQAVTTAAAVLQFVFVVPHNPKVAVAGTQQFTANGHYSDTENAPNNIHALPFGLDSVTWSTTGALPPNGGTASISPTGLATGVAAGVVFVNAKITTASPNPCPLNNCVAGLDVGLTGISVTPPSASIAKGTQLKFTANGSFSDGTPRDVSQAVNWSSSAATVAKVDITGNATAVGQVNTTATLSAFTNGAACPGTFCGQATITVAAPNLVSIAVTPATPAGVPIGSTLQFTAIGTYTDSSTQNLTNTATWNSSSTATATISNAAGSNGLATAKGLTPPSTNITAAYLGKTSPAIPFAVTKAALFSITVSPKKPSIAKGDQQQFTAKGHYTDGQAFTLPFAGDSNHAPANSLTWVSTNTAVATIDSVSGNATSVDTGATTIQATSAGITGSTVLTVTAAALKSIAVAPPSPTIPQNTTQQFTATGTFTDGSTQDLTATATWNSSDTTVATISNASGSEGLATGIVSGATTTTNITAQYTVTSGATVTSPPDVLTVTPRSLQSIAVTPNPATLNAGQQQQFTATGTYNAPPTPQDITQSAAWTSDNTAVATVNMSTGLAKALAGGTANIKATVGSVSGSAPLNVSSATLQSITVTPQNAVIRLDFTQQYTATGNYSDGSTQDLTDVAAWSESSGTGTIDATGLYTPSTPGPDTVTATCSGACPGVPSGTVSGTADLTVTF